MVLSAISRGRIEKPNRVLVYGYPAIGKSTFASSAPSPIFLPAEEGTNHLDVTRFPRPERWSDLFDALETLTSEPHEFKTLVVDTLDALEPLNFKAVCEAAGKRSIADFPHGAGYVAANDQWRLLLARLERLIDTGESRAS
jgi:hypothetical protein